MHARLQLLRALPRALVALALLASACSPASRSEPQKAGRPVSLAQVAPSPKEDVPSALTDMSAQGLPAALVDPSQIIPGGPPPDGIPSIDHPKFEKTSDVDWLKDREPVLVAGSGKAARAYPIQILTWHEIVNETIEGDPVAITYCPLCNSGIGFHRRVGNRVLEFGTSGKLYRSALVMYDRQTESLWSQFTGKAIAGVFVGSELEYFPVSIASWSDWHRGHPNSWVLSRHTGFDRDYGRNPYVGYDDPSSEPWLFRAETDRRMPPMTRIVGINSGPESIAVVLDHLLKRRVIETTIDGSKIVIWARPGTASALDKDEVAAGRDVGATGVFQASLDGRALHFDPSGEGFRDRETGSHWDVLGNALAGPLAGSNLAHVEHVDTFWFAWAAFRPDTRIVGGR